MTQKYHFHAEIEDAGDGGAFVYVPFDVETTFGKKRLKVKATIDGVPYRGTLVRMGGPKHILLVLKQIRVKIGKGYGDEVAVVFEEDLDPREVDLPPDLQKALVADPPAHENFKRLSYTHQKEYVRWVTEAKHDQTRQRRIQKTIEMLNQVKNEH